MREFTPLPKQCACCAPKPTTDKVTKAYARGVNDERERIIKLLEELIPAKPTYQMPMEYWVQCKLVEQAIALIKGENK